MEIIFIQALASNGQPSGDSIRLERALRKKGFWRSISQVHPSRDATRAEIIIENGNVRETFGSAAEFQQRFDLDTIDRHEAQAACW